MIICNHITDCLQSAIYPSRLIAIYNTTFFMLSKIIVIQLHRLLNTGSVIKKQKRNARCCSRVALRIVLRAINVL